MRRATWVLILMGVVTLWPGLCGAEPSPLEGRVSRVRPDGSAEVRFDGDRLPQLQDVFIIHQDGMGIGECRITSLARSEIVATPHPWFRGKLRTGDTIRFLRHGDPTGAPADHWHDFTPPEGEFTVLAPPLFRSKVTRSRGGEDSDLVEYVFGDGREGVTYHVTYFDLPGTVTDVEGVLDKGADRITTKGDQVLGRHSIRKGNLPGREMEMVRNDMKVRVRLYLSGNRVFMLLTPTKKKGYSPNANRFLDSLRLPPPKGRSRA